MEENGYDTTPYEQIKTECIEDIRAFCAKWGRKYLDKVRDFIKHWYRDMYPKAIADLEKKIRNGDLLEDTPEQVDSWHFSGLDGRAHVFAGLRAMSLAEEMDVDEIERLAAKVDERFRKLIPAIAKMFANVPDMFAGYHRKGSWWYHEARRLHQLYRAQLPPGTPDRDRYT